MKKKDTRNELKGEIKRKSSGSMDHFSDEIKGEISSFAHWKFKKGSGVSHNSSPLIEKCVGME
jgi:hypothetical protein